MRLPARPPFDLEVAVVCDRFKVLPSQLKKESVKEVRRMLALLHEWERDLTKRP